MSQQEEKKNATSNRELIGRPHYPKELDPEILADAEEGWQNWAGSEIERYAWLQHINGQIDAHVHQWRIVKLRRLQFAVAASLVIGLVVFAVWSYYQQTPSYEELFAAHFEVLPSTLPASSTNINRGAKDNTIAPSPHVQQAIRYYEQGRYQEANRHFTIALTSDSLMHQDIVQFHYGISLLAAGDADSAVEPLKMAIAQSVSPVRAERGRWYLALAYLRTNRLEAARQELIQLNAIAPSSEIKALLQDLEKKIKTI